MQLLVTWVATKKFEAMANVSAMDTKEISQIISRCSMSIVEAQTLINRRAFVELVSWSEQVSRLQGGSEVLDELIDEISPAPQMIVQCHTSVSLQCEERRQTGVGVEVKLFGRPIHTFYSRRYANETEENMQIEVECSSAPIRAEFM